MRAQDTLVRSVRPAIERRERALAALAQNLAHLNPSGVLERGYAIVADRDGRIVHDSRDLSIGDDVALTFARGGASAKITDNNEGQSAVSASSPDRLRLDADTAL